MYNEVKLSVSFSKKITSRLAFRIWISSLLTVILVTKSSGRSFKRSRYSDDCLNINAQIVTIPKFSSSEKCIRLWSLTNCKGKEIVHTGIGRSASGCSKCRKKESNGVICTGLKSYRNCTKLELLCHKHKPTFRALMEDTEWENSGVPITIEIIDMSTFTVYEPDLDIRALSERPIPFIAYHRINSNKALDAYTVKFRQKHKVVFFIHGYATRDLEDGQGIGRSLFNGAHNVDYFVIVDWRKWSLPSDNSDKTWPPNYEIVARQNVPIVAGKVLKFLLSKLSNDNYIYIVGYSLGAHVAGTAARRAAKNGLKVDRITGLDAAGPIFEYSLGIFPVDTTYTLRKSDAKFVDLIHCSELAGLRNPGGHLDIYLKENKCVFAPCKHHRGVELYMSSLTRCSLITCPRNGRPCSASTISEFGYNADKYPGRGEHELRIITDLSNWRDNECNSFFNLYLPAKDRVCQRPPDKNKNCKNKPYLTECSVSCSGGRSNPVGATAVCAHKPNMGFRKRDVNQFDSSSETNFTFEAKSHKVKWFRRREC